jgi:hypothetical protein
MLSVSRLYSVDDGMINDYRADGGKKTDWGTKVKGKVVPVLN